MSGRIEVTLACSVCSARNYRTSRKREQQGQISRRKYCVTCNTHTVHLETK